MSTTKKICILYWDLGLGGIQKRIKDLVRAMSVRYPAYEIHVLLRRKLLVGFDEQVINTPRAFVHYYPFTGAIRPPLGFIFWIAWMYIYLSPQVILTFQALLSSVVVLCRYVFFWIHSRLVINEGAVTSNALKIDNISHLGLLVRIFYKFADTIIVPTIACRDDLILKYHISPKKLKLVPNWTMFPPQTPLKSLYDIIYIGRFSNEKNPMETIQLVRKLLHQYPALKVAMIGDGYLRAQLQAEVRQYGLLDTVRFFQSSNDIQKYIRHAKVLFVPSRNEGMPNVVLEAAISQVPSVVSDFPGAREVIQHGETGYIYATLEEAIERVTLLLRHGAVRKKMGKAAQKNIIKRYGQLTQRTYMKTVLAL